jgi:proton translocating ATP synthase F1 alpha subunit
MILCNFHNSSKALELLSSKTSSTKTAIKPFACHYVAKHASYSHHMISKCLFFIQKRYNTTFKDAKKQQVIKKNIKTKEENLKGVKIGAKSTESHVQKTFNEFGYITTVSGGIAEARGILNVKSGELVKIYPSNMTALALNLSPNKVGLVLCGAERFVNQTDIVSITGTLISIKINTNILGSVVDALGFSLMSKVKTDSKLTTIMNVEQSAPDIISRQPIFEPLLTGITIIDSLVPIGRGQRELIIGDRQTGKTSIGIDTILNQSNVVCVYVSIGQKCSGVAQLFRTIEKANKTKNLVIVSSTASDAAPLQYLAPYTGCTIAEYFRDNFGDATLVIYDDLSKQATAYRQLSLLLRRPPGREAFPGDVFYLHSRLLERAAKLSANLGGGSLTALPIVETQAGDVSAYIPTNVISITDGQIFLDAELFTQGVRPAVNVGLSVSRVGTAAQYPSLKGLSANIKLELAQYRDILTFVKFGSDIDEFTAQVLHRGERLVEIFKQHNNKPNITELQIILIAFATSGFLDDFSSNELKMAISFASYIVNLIFNKPILIVLTYFFRYFNAVQIQKILKNLIGYVVTKNNKIK